MLASTPATLIKSERTISVVSPATSLYLLASNGTSGAVQPQTQSTHFQSLPARSLRGTRSLSWLNAPSDPQSIMDLERDYVLQTYARYPLVLGRGKGCYLYDLAGKRYLDS